MLWIVTVKGVQIPLRASSEMALLDQLEDLLQQPLANVDYQLHSLPDFAEILANSAIVLPQLDGRD